MNIIYWAALILCACLIIPACKIGYEAASTLRAGTVDERILSALALICSVVLVCLCGGLVVTLWQVLV